MNFSSKLARVLCEEMDHGALFMATSVKGYLSDNGIFTSNTNIAKACADMVNSWVAYLDVENRKIVRRHAPMEVVNDLINRKSLVVIVKLQSHLGEAAVEYEVEGLDGILSYVDVINMIRSGKITDSTKISFSGGPLVAVGALPEFQDALRSSSSAGSARPAGPMAGLATDPKKSMASNVKVTPYHYISAARIPKFSATQARYIISMFGVNLKTDHFLWHQTLASRAPGKVSALELFKGSR
jgi:hypothetical protein